MTEYDDSLIKEMLDKQVPLRLDATPDWSEVVRRAAGDSSNEAGGARPHRPAGWAASFVRRRRFLVPALGLAVLATVAAVATAGSVYWWNGAPRLSAIDTSSSEKLVKFTLTSDYSVWSKGDTIAIWRVPQQGGVECYFRALASSEPSAPGSGGANSLGGGSCGLGGAMEVPSGQTFRVEFSTTATGGYNWLVSGQVAADRGIARLEIQSANGRLPVSYANGWFLGQLPSSGSADELPQGGPYVLVGYDENGTEVTRLDLGQARKGLRAH